MKKTVITLAIVTTTFSSAAMAAWIANGIGGTLGLSGHITAYRENPWEVLVGAPVTGLDAKVEKGRCFADITTAVGIPVLGIRTKSFVPFLGGMGITPQIDYHGKVDLNGFIGTSNTTSLILDVTDFNDKRIGLLHAKLTAGALYSRNYLDLEKVVNISRPEQRVWAFISAEKSGDAFYGGLPKSRDRVSDPREQLNTIDTEFSAHFSNQDGGLETINSVSFSYPFATYSGYYGSGINRGNNIKITLNSKIIGDEVIKWKASLPITVSYM